jgi:23S rRNA (uracil1939-C5)-methyltransferase
MRKKKYPVLEQMEVVDAAAEGKAIAKLDNKVVFVQYAVPGDVVDVQVLRKRKKFLEGKAIHFHRYSDKRVEPFCSHFGTCGGCKWQAMNYTDQLAYKAKQVNDQITRIGKLEPETVLPIKAAPATTHYRNKLEFTFSNKRWLTEAEIQNGKEIEQRNALGFHIQGMYDKILDIDTCYLQADPSNAIRLFIKEYALKNELPFFDLREQTGLLRNVILRNTSTGQWMVLMSFFKNEQSAIKGLMEAIQSNFREVTSLFYVINDKKNDSLDGLTPIHFAGNDHIMEEMEGLQFRIGPRSFYQTNSEQAYALYQIVREFAQLEANDVLYDLYTGTGTIGLFLAKSVKKVIGIEYVPEAIEDAKMNAQHNGIDNSAFYAGDMKDLLTTDFIEKHGNPDIVVTDPPRAGMHADVVERLLHCGAKRIVYVSCNPATQARDMALLSERYELKKTQAVDMFPHTHHVENVALLELK